MPGRGITGSNAYRYGFNGKENDNEVKGSGNQQDYGMRVYDPRLGKFLSVDPLSPKYPELTPYQFASNRPIDAVDLDGLESWEINKSTTTGSSSSNYYRNSSYPTNSNFSGTVYGPYANGEAAISAVESGTATIYNYHSSSERYWHDNQDGYDKVNREETYSPKYIIG